MQTPNIKQAIKDHFNPTLPLDYHYLISHSLTWLLNINKQVVTEKLITTFMHEKKDIYCTKQVDNLSVLKCAEYCFKIYKDGDTCMRSYIKKLQILEHGHVKNLISNYDQFDIEN